MSVPAGEVVLDRCGCCEDAPADPSVLNAPGLKALAYRIGTYATFLERMRLRLHSAELPESNDVFPLQDLTTRASDDPALALLDGWATVADVLTFYQERIANEGFLRTATERRSVLELARAIGYELAPGVAASTWLAFTIDDSPGASGEAEIPAKTQLQNIPTRQGELPQTFETTDAYTARAEWNLLKPRTTLEQPFDSGETVAYLEGISTLLEPGDAVLLVGSERSTTGAEGSERWDLRILQTVEADTTNNRTKVTWQPGLGSVFPPVKPAADPDFHVFRQRVHQFGYNAPDFRLMPDTVQDAYRDSDGDEEGEAEEWPRLDEQPDDNAAHKRIYLDAVYPKVVPGSWVALMEPRYSELYRVKEAVPDARADFGLTAQVTRLRLDTNENLERFGVRETLVLCQPEQLTLVEMPDDSAIEGNAIELAGLVSGLEAGHALIVEGTVEESRESAAEIVFVATTVDGESNTTIVLEESLANRYVRDATLIYANVVPATHGETVADEVLGGGDGASSNQTFKLKKPPLTYVSAATASGAQSSLEVQVDRVKWGEVSSLYGQTAASRSYIVRIDDNANAYVIFGDGKQGARLPTGQENVKATYRSGIGLAGEVAAESITLLKKRPFGVKSVTNPVPATGAADPETLDEARDNAPLTVLTFERIVSVQDFEDFARAFAGIGKAAAVVLASGETQRVHATVATVSGEVVASGSELANNLLAAMNAARDPLQELELGTFDSLLFNVSARVWIDAAYAWEDVEAALRKRMLEVFGFDAREFGQPVTAAEVIATLQGVTGVIAIDLDTLYVDGDAATLNTLLTADLAHYAPKNPGSAKLVLVVSQLLQVNTDGISLQQVLS